MKDQTKKIKKVGISSFYQKYGVFFIFIVEVIIFSVLSKNFLTLNNLVTVGKQISFTGIAAVGSTLLMITGGIDLATGSNLAFSGVICTFLMINVGLPIWLCVIITIAFGFLSGTVNGIAFTKFNVSPLIATLAMQYILKGAAFLITDAKAIYNLPASFKVIGQGFLFGIIPIPLAIMVAAFIFGAWVLNSTYLGRYIYAVGGNVEAARLSGINTKRVSMIVFIASSMFAALAGVLMAARMGSGQPSIGGDFPMDVITAIVLGGVSINGGSGKILGVLFGALIMGVLSNGMIMLNLNDYVQWVVKGIVLLFAVAMSNINVSGIAKAAD